MMTQFYLDQDPTTYPQPWETSLYVTPGQYLVSQEPHEGWRISDIECTDPDGNSSGDVSNRSATIRMDAGEEIHCTFTNVPAVGDINIYQTTLPQDPTSFQFSGDVGTVGLADDGDESGADGTWRNFGTQGLTEGTYVETQSFLDGWNLTDISCNDPDGGTTVDLATRTVTFDLDAGETIDCTFTDQPTAPTKGDVKFTLNTIPDNAADVSFSGGLGSFALDDDGNPDNGLTNWADFLSLDAGTYAETVSVPTGWTVSAIQCTDPDGGTTTNAAAGTLSIDLDPTETVSCAVTVTQAVQHNQVNINLDAVPNDPVDVAFDFGSILKFTLDDDADGSHTNGMEYNDMDLGPWPLVAHVPSGWRVKDLACTDPDNGTTVDKANAKATIDLDAGETINCKLTIEPIPAPPPPPPAATCNGKVATIVGGAGATTIRGTAGNDVIVDLDGANQIDAKRRQRHDLHRPRQRRHRRRRRRTDWIDAGGGTNAVDAGAGTNTVYAGAGNDTIVGGAGADKLYGGDGSNVVSGGNGNDPIVTGSGNDQIDGGKGSDDRPARRRHEHRQELRGCRRLSSLRAGLRAPARDSSRVPGVPDMTALPSPRLAARHRLRACRDRRRPATASARRQAAAATPVCNGLPATSSRRRARPRSTARRATTSSWPSTATSGSTPAVATTRSARAPATTSSTPERATTGSRPATARTRSTPAPATRSSIAGSGDDVIVGGIGNDTAYGGDGDNLLSTQGGDDVIVGGLGDDRIDGAKGFDTCYGGGGLDRIGHCEAGNR